MSDIEFTNPAARRMGKRICARRTELGMRQVDLAEASGVAQGLISRLESGQHFPTLQTLIKLKRALGLTDEQFAEWVEVAS